MFLGYNLSEEKLNLLGAEYTGVNKSIVTPAIGSRVVIDSRNVAVVLHHLLSLTARYSQRERHRKKQR